MKTETLFIKLKTALENIIKENNIEEDKISILAKTLTPIEAIGDTVRKDFPIIVGKEVMLEADYKGSRGQAFTSAPVCFKGQIKDILDLDLMENDYNRGLFIATLNAVMAYLKLTDKTIHCKTEEPEICAKNSIEYIKTNFGSPKIALIGYQPALIENLAQHFELRVLDLSPENICQTRYGVMIEDGEKDYQKVIEWAELVLCTGSTLCNGSIVNFLELEKEVVFFGTTIAGTAALFNLKRMCLCSH